MPVNRTARLQEISRARAMRIWLTGAAAAFIWILGVIFAPMIRFFDGVIPGFFIAADQGRVIVGVSKSHQSDTGLLAVYPRFWLGWDAQLTGVVLDFELLWVYGAAALSFAMLFRAAKAWHRASSRLRFVQLKRVCSGCGYRLDGLNESDNCPECGRTGTNPFILILNKNQKNRRSNNPGSYPSHPPESPRIEEPISMLGRVFKAYDVRGVYPDPLNENLAWQIGYGCSRFLLSDAHAAGETSPMMKNIVVGRDMRSSSPSLTKSLIKGMNDHGGDVIDLGLCDTSMIYFAVNHLDCAGGVMVTASHNPPQYNGFKVSKRKAKPVGETTGLAEVRKHAAMVDKQTLVAQHGRIEQRDLWPAYAKHVRSFLDLTAKDGSKRSLKLVIDASNGMAGTMIPKIFGKNAAGGIGPVPGLSIVELNFENTKNQFAHEPNPLVASNVRQLQEAVKEHKADIGACFDGDADRCVLVDEKGNIVGCDHLTALLARYFLAKKPGAAVVYDLRSTKAVEEEIKAAGGKPVRSRVGHVFMKAAMAEHKAVFGGELSGHFYFQDNFNADSGAIALCVALTVMAKSGKSLSSQISHIGRYAQSGEINFQVEDKEAALATLRKSFGPGSPTNATIDELDGVTLDCFNKEHWWCNVRMSNTEPLLRLNAEAKDRKTLDKVIAQIAPMLGKRVDH